MPAPRLAGSGRAGSGIPGRLAAPGPAGPGMPVPGLAGPGPLGCGLADPGPRAPGRPALAPDPRPTAAERRAAPGPAAAGPWRSCRWCSTSRTGRPAPVGHPQPGTEWDPAMRPGPAVGPGQAVRPGPPGTGRAAGLAAARRTARWPNPYQTARRARTGAGLPSAGDTGPAARVWPAADGTGRAELDTNQRLVSRYRIPADLFQHPRGGSLPDKGDAAPGSEVYGHSRRGGQNIRFGGPARCADNRSCS